MAIAWEKYRKTVREYDAILEHANAVSAALVGLTPADRNVSYGEQIFVKLLGHCITLRAMAPDPERKVPRGERPAIPPCLREIGA